MTPSPKEKPTPKTEIEGEKIEIDGDVVSGNKVTNVFNIDLNDPKFNSFIQHLLHTPNNSTPNDYPEIKGFIEEHHKKIIDDTAFKEAIDLASKIVKKPYQSINPHHYNQHLDEFASRLKENLENYGLWSNNKLIPVSHDWKVFRRGSTTSILWLEKLNQIWVSVFDKNVQWGLAEGTLNGVSQKATCFVKAERQYCIELTNRSHGERPNFTNEQFRIFIIGITIDIVNLCYTGFQNTNILNAISDPEFVNRVVWEASQFSNKKK